MSFRFNILVALFFMGASVFSQKKTIQPEDYFKWNTVDSYKIGQTGKIIVYEISKLRNDGILVIYNTETGNKDTIPRGNRSRINSEENFVVFEIEPEYDTIRKLKIDKVKKSKFPKDSLGIYLVEKDSVIKIPKLKSFYLPEEGEWMAYKLEHNKKIKVEGNKKKRKKKKNKEEPEITSKGKRICFFNPIQNIKKEFNDVGSVYAGDNDKFFAFTVQHKIDTLDSNFVYLFNTESLEATKIFSGVKANTVRISDQMDQIVFYGSQDTSEVKVYDLFHWTENNGVRKIVDTNHTSLPQDYSVSDNSNLFFSEDGTKIYFGIWEIKRKEPKDTIPKNEKYKVDIWHYKDRRVQPEQLLSKRRDQKKSYKCVYHLNTNKLVQLEDEDLGSGYSINEGNSKWYYANSKRKYQHTYSYDFPWKRDHYLVNNESGERKLVGEGGSFQYTISPSGRYFVYWDYDNYKIKLFDTLDDSLVTVKTDSIPIVDLGNGTPARDGTHGFAGWSKDEELYFYSEKDIWIYRPEQDKVNRVTRYREFNFFNPDEKLRIVKLDRDSNHIDLNRCLIKGFNEKNKNTSFYGYDNGDYKKLVESAHAYTNPLKAKKSDDLLFRRSSLRESKDIYHTKDFKNIERITDINPQQKDYNWANVELVKWVTGNKDTLEGLFYTPENLDKSKKYPMLVYFYEEYSDRIHTYYRPKPTASIIYPTEYCSNGYVVFIPNVKYEEGHPAKSAYDCIVSGTDSMITRFPFIDSTKLGLQGQSWGGYQTAQLVTMTDKYEAAMAGAPVSNMFSAFGGIRWGSGLSRQFQYEKTQSRIGATIWEKPQLYIENSPLFHLPKVKTPLLIMHNDNDGAVPWYQGIELFMGLRRLEKPVWMLNYNGDEHNLMKTANRIDLSIRMKQFFDHFLMGKPIPQWLDEGLPAKDKGKISGYDTKEN